MKTQETTGKLCFISLISFQDEITHLVDGGKGVDIIFLVFSKTFDTVPHSIFLDKLSSCDMSRFVVHWVKNWLNGWAQRVVVNGARSGWRPVTSGESVLYTVIHSYLSGTTATRKVQYWSKL